MSGYLLSTAKTVEESYMLKNHTHKKADCDVVQPACVPADIAANTPNQALEDHWTGLPLPGFPRDVSPTLLLEYEERWVREEQAPSWSEIMGKLALTCAIYRTHNPMLLSWRTGYPLAVTRTFVECVLSIDGWLDPENYPQLVQDVRTLRDDDEVDRTATEALGVLDASVLVRFAAAWEQAMGLPRS